MKFLTLLIALNCSLLAAENLKLDTLVTQRGKTYHAVEVKSVKPDSVFIMHRDGGCSIKVEDLSADLQKKLGIELDDEAKEYRAKTDALKNSQAKADYAARLRMEKLKRERQQALYVKDASNRDSKQSKSSEDTANSFYFILQLTDEGVLAYKGKQKYTRIKSSGLSSVGGGGGVAGGRSYIGKGDELFHIKLDSLAGLVDNQRIKLKTEESGTYQYTSTEGSKVTVKQLKGVMLD